MAELCEAAVATRESWAMQSLYALLHLNCTLTATIELCTHCCNCTLTALSELCTAASELCTAASELSGVWVRSFVLGCTEN